MDSFSLQILHSQAKILPGQSPKIEDLLSCPWTALGAERTAVQIAICYNWTEGQAARTKTTLAISSSLARNLDLYQVKLVASELPAFPYHDANYLTTTPGLLPDLLRRLPPETDDSAQESRKWSIVLPADKVAVFWLETRLPAELAGEHPIRIELQDDAGTAVAKDTLTLHILNAQKPQQTLRRTEWFYADCLADYYQVEVFSDKHWIIIENFMRMATAHGINTILTPLFTPPLDTAIGGERTTVQLVDVCLQNKKWTFSFARLKRWLDLARDCGYVYFEMSHLFTQWGAKAAPKIMAWENGQLQQVFGWDTPATGDEYRSFLAAFLPSLTAFLNEYKIADSCYFHLSDEPSSEDLANYKLARDIVEPFIQGFPIIDALSDISFYEKGIIDKPVPASDHIEPFLAARIPGLWTYYCCGQSVDVANCFMAMPAARIRILGTQLYKYNIEGFLHWGYNFYNSQHSLTKIDPYRVTDADGAFPSGDAFLVYPGEGGHPEPSLRLKLLDQAVSDWQALKLLEDLTTRQFVLELIEEDLPQPLTFKEYPQDSAWLLNLRHRVDTALKNLLDG